MKIVTEQECQEWLKVSLTTDFSWETVRALYPHCVTYGVPSDTGKKTVLGRVLTGCVARPGAGLFWITGWGIFPSSENMVLFDGYRKSLGENRTIHAAPGHVFGESDLGTVECLLDLALYFYWDSSLFDGAIVLRTSHDECFSVYARNKAHMQEISSNLDRLKLKQL